MLKIFTIIIFIIVIFLPNFINDNQLLGYYGSLAGAFIGVMGAYTALNIQLKQDKKSFNKTQTDNTFFNLLNLFKEVKNPIPPDIFEQLLAVIKSKYTIEAQKNQLTESKEELLSILNSEEVSKIAEERGVTYYIDVTKNCITEPNFTNFSLSLNKFSDFPDKIQEFKKVYDIGDNIRENPDYTSINKKDKENIISEIFSRPLYFQELANYLRLFHRMVKFIMTSELEISEKKQYLGILRSLLSPDELLVIFYNTFYSNRGVNLKAQLKPKNEYTEFFASSEDIDIFNKNVPDTEDKIDLPFFSYDKLIFKDDDLLLIKSLIDPTELN